jgi:putative addiction module killer protein
MNTIKVVTFISDSGKEPFMTWLNRLDSSIQGIILARIARVRLGNFGDCKQIKGSKGVWELRIDFGSGYRVYFGKIKEKNLLVVLLLGGDKKTQTRDIEKAQSYWLSYKE